MTYPCLYILCRNDLASMNPGKMAAQACHAANQMVHEYRQLSSMHDQFLIDLYEEWYTSAKGFGTTLTLSVNEKELRDSIKLAKALGFHAGITHDPSYPLIDGQTLHLIPLDTCGYVFWRKDMADIILRKFPLVP